ncbi:winged helix-turn-helix domain-containing protein [Pseudomonas chlororaphis]|uniref:winged helix-turn-helix domain-containing protein n=1 Tax=Pseudomonas chlororaphis TaxID=587753 RepID=UPI0030CC4A27
MDVVIQSLGFGSYVLQADGLLLHERGATQLPPKELHVLRLLLKDAGALVSKNSLIERVWPRCDVADESLTRCIYVLRKLLGRQNDYIKTVYGKGYRFMAQVFDFASSPNVPAVAPSLQEMPVGMQGYPLGSDLHREFMRWLTSAFVERPCVVPLEMSAGRRQV